MTATVAVLRAAPVKGLAQDAVEELTLDQGGIREDRRFAVVRASGRALYTAELRRLRGATARWDQDGERLAIRFADGAEVEGPAAGGAPAAAHGYARRPMPGGQLVDGPFAAALSERLEEDVHLVRLPAGVGGPGPITLLALASVARLAEQLGVDELDPRRFKMSVELDGAAAHEEDTWDGCELAIGEARVRVGGQVPRCVLTTWDPDTYRRDADTLKAILAYRPAMAGGEPPFGMYATVTRPGPIRVGDPVTLV
jgi:uncharacterized protein YcbX